MYISEHSYNSDGKRYTYLKMFKSRRVGARVVKETIYNFGRIDDSLSPAYYLSKYLKSTKTLSKRYQNYTLPMAIYTVCTDYLGLDNILTDIVKNSRIEIEDVHSFFNLAKVV